MTKAANEQVPHTSTTSPTRPITEIAKLNSNQLSLETPQNRAGMSRLSMPVLLNFNARHRICSVNDGQNRELGEAGLDVANDFRYVRLSTVARLARIDFLHLAPQVSLAVQ